VSWSIGWDTQWKRDIGYGVPAYCDFPRCDAEIDRGLSYVCGHEPYGGEVGCGLYFCDKHRNYLRKGKTVCSRCGNYRPAFNLKPEHPRWLQFKATDPSWAEWRAEQSG